jgi:tellurite resistance-related uncharacterized protein
MAKSKKKWKVVTPWGQETIKGTGVVTDNGELHIVGASDVSVAVFAPNQWHSVERKSDQ